MQSTENEDMLIVAVCLAAIVPKVFHYAVPQDAELVPGQFVLVPFGRKKLSRGDMGKTAPLARK